MPGYGFGVSAGDCHLCELGDKSSLPLSLETTSCIEFGMWLLSFKAQVGDYKFEQLYAS